MKIFEKIPNNGLFLYLSCFVCQKFFQLCLVAFDNAMIGGLELWPLDFVALSLTSSHRECLCSFFCCELITYISLSVKVMKPKHSFTV